MTKTTRRELLAVIKARYLKADRLEKTAMLDRIALRLSDTEYAMMMQKQKAEL